MSNIRILIAEDESLIAMMLEDFVDALGHSVVQIVDSVESGLNAVEELDFDVAILDVNLRDRQPSWPIADALEVSGKPFFLTSGGDIEPPPGRHSQRLFVEKPFTLQGIDEAIKAVTGHS
ncbi:response regulator [Parasphingopyxis sp.]|uniref:response regulator n=1 Tax=Parasphingopyxis sp. TaxID=1920299 RepID=UPI002608AA84|nr:response regulator [Parasphingopyxis sp.]